MIRFNIFKGLFSGMILIDLHKAFDNVYCCIILEVLKVIGLHNDILSWFKSYFNDKKTFFYVFETSSEFMDVKWHIVKVGCEVNSLPLVLLYVNDKLNAVECDPFFMLMVQCCWHPNKQCLKLKLNGKNNLISLSSC